MNIDVLRELDERKVDYEKTSDRFVKLKCEFHNDDSPSASINLETGFYKCWACNKKAPFVTYLQKLTKKQIGVLLDEMAAKYGKSSNQKTISPQVADRDHNNYKNAPDQIKQVLKDRMITEDHIAKHRIGYRDMSTGGTWRITIPVYDEAGYIVNLRKYNTNHDQKFAHEKGFGQPRLYPIEQLEYDTIVLCGGELKAIASADVLNKENIGAISATCGETNWEPKLDQSFRDKVVYIAYDIDEAGKAGAFNVASSLNGLAKKVYIVELPLDIEKYPKGDLNDFLREGGDLLEVLSNTEEFELYIPSIATFIDEEDYRKVSFNNALSEAKINRGVCFDSTVVHIYEAPIYADKRLSISCGKDQKFCSTCSIYHRRENPTLVEIPKDSEIVLMMCDESDKNKPQIQKKCLKIPVKCDSVDIKTDDYYSINLCQILPKMDLSAAEDMRAKQACYIIGDPPSLSDTYEMKGILCKHPRSHEATFLIHSKSSAGDALSNFQSDNLAALEVFSPEKWTLGHCKEKLEEIYKDLACNVTRIFNRNMIHAAVDLAYHSPLIFNFGKSQVNGWIGGLIIGDSGQGKSDTCNKLMRHYDLGQKVDCKSTSAAGLMGGASQLNDKWTVESGILTTQDRRIIILEEMKGLSTFEIGNLTNIRSEGVVCITKMGKKIMPARTRMLGISNPRDDKVVSNFSYGTHIVENLVGAPEDVRRFDYVLIISANEVDVMAELTKTQEAEHIYTTDLCKELVLWAWTRTPELIHFECEQLVYSTAKKLVNKYACDVMLLDSGTTHTKVARIAASFAARLFSSENTTDLYVRNCHVELAYEFLDNIYSSEAFKYDVYAEQNQTGKPLLREREVKEAILSLQDPSAFVRMFKSKDKISMGMFRAVTALDRESFEDFKSIMVRTEAIQGNDRYIGKTDSFAKFLADTPDEEFMLDRKPQYQRDNEF